MSSGEKTTVGSNPFGSAQPQASAGLSVPESVFSNSEKERVRPRSFSLKCCFGDRFTDQFREPRRATQLTRSREDHRFFENAGICVYCRQTVKCVDSSRASVLHRFCEKDVCAM